MAFLLEVSDGIIMRFSFAKSKWRTGAAVLLSMIATQITIFICAQHNWDITNLLTVLLFALIIASLVFGFTANIGMVGRILWLAVVFGYMVFLAVQVYRYFSPNTPD